ncbi:MAG: hypothetical protein ACRDNF_07475 [Streptosporangiaceae bacterium]
MRIATGRTAPSTIWGAAWLQVCSSMTAAASRQTPRPTMAAPSRG